MSQTDCAIRATGYFAVTQCHSTSLHTSSYWCRPNMVLSCIMSEVQRDNGQKWRFFYTLLHSTFPLGGPRRNIVIAFGIEKLQRCDHPTVNISLMISLAVSTQYRRVTDEQTNGQTNRHTSCDGIDRAMHTHRSVKTESRRTRHVTKEE